MIAPSAWLFGHEVRAQQRLFWRNREAAFFIFALPLIFIVLLGSVYGDNEIDGVGAATYLLAGMIGYGIAATAFAGLAISMVIRRESGVLKRVRGTPMPTPAYLAAVIGSAFVVVGIQLIGLLLLGRYVVDAEWPSSPGVLVGAVLLGTAVFAALGLAITTPIRSDEGASAVVNALFLPMAFTSGVFFSTNTLPDFLAAISEILPLTMFLELVRAAFLDDASALEYACSIGGLIGWGILGVVVAARWFRWEPRAT